MVKWIKKRRRLGVLRSSRLSLKESQTAAAAKDAPGPEAALGPEGDASGANAAAGRKRGDVVRMAAVEL